MKSKSIKGNSTEEIQAALDQAMEDGFKPSVAVVFISIKQDRASVLNMLKQKNIEVFGASSSGEFINGHQTVGGIVILLLELAPEKYKIIFEEIKEDNLNESISQLANKAYAQFQNPSLIICSTSIRQNGDWLDGKSVVNAMEQSFGPERIFFGGMAGDDWELKQSFVFTGENVTDYGISALVLDGDQITMSGMAITGWKPMGIKRTATKSKNYFLYEIDGQPAVELYMKYLGKESKLLGKDFNIFKELSLEYPFITERGENETLLITPREINREENALVLDMPLPEGSKFWFAQPPEFDIVEEVLSKAAQLQESTNDYADALLVFSCAGRQPVLGPLATEENDGLAEVWKTPMAGFFTYGEYGRSFHGKANFHSGACCWVALKEK